MKFEEAKEQFVQAWGALGSKWGINPTMAKIHALLMIAPEPMSTEDVMEALNVSRGNANMNIRALMDWGLVWKDLKSGERKDFFSAEKDIWKVSRMIMEQRKKRELEPMQRVLEGISTNLEGEGNTEAIAVFQKVTGDIKDFSQKANVILETTMRAEKNWFLNKFMKLFQ